MELLPAWGRESVNDSGLALWYGQDRGCTFIHWKAVELFRVCFVPCQVRVIRARTYNSTFICIKLQDQNVLVYLKPSGSFSIAVNAVVVDLSNQPMQYVCCTNTQHDWELLLSLTFQACIHSAKLRCVLPSDHAGSGFYIIINYSSFFLYKILSKKNTRRGFAFC